MVKAATAALWFCLVVSSLLLIRPGHVECAVGDPDDDSWSANDGIGLAGGGRWTADSGISTEEPTFDARPKKTRRDDSTPGETDVDDGGSRKRVGGKVYGSRDSGVDRSDLDSGAGDGDLGDDNSVYDVGGSDLGDDKKNYGVGDSDISDDADDNGADDIVYEVDDSNLGIDDIDFNDSGYDLFDENDIDFDNSDYLDSSELRLEDADYDYEYSTDDSDFDSDYDYSDYEYDNDDYDYDNDDYDYDYTEDDSRYSSGDIDFDFDDDSEYGNSDEFSDRFGHNSRRSNRDFDYDDADGDNDSDVDILREVDDDLEDFSFGRRRRGRRRNTQRGSGGRRGGHHGRVRTLSARQATSTTVGEDADIEIDDASANPEDIPSGYFDRQETRGNRMALTTSGSIDFPGFRLVIREANNWWKFNDNVCLKKELLRSTELEEDDVGTAVYTVKCSDNSLTEYDCNVTESNRTVSISYRLTYTCCRGYTRLRGDKGCPRNKVKSPTKGLSFEALLRMHGYSQRIIDLFGTVLSNDTKKQWTVFVPAMEALDDALGMVGFSESREAPVPEWFVRTVLNHFVQPARPTGSLRSGQALPTLAKTGGGLLVTKTKRGGVLVNCRSIRKANQPFNQYSLVHFTSSVLGIHQSNLYQLMLKRLDQAAVSLETAKRLLAPIKLILTGTRPVTVFLHMPSNAELENSCYARNLRAAIINGVECNASLATLEPLRTIDGKVVRITKSGKSVVVDGNRLLISTDLMASNGVLHIVNATESLTGYDNAVTRRLKSSDLFKPLFGRPGRAEGSLALLLPPVNGSHSYANTSARWDNATELAAFGRRHLLDNATGMVRGPSARLGMLGGTQRDFVQLLTRQASASIFGRDKPVRHQFVDCVRVVRTAKDCGGTVYLFLRGELPDFRASPPTQKYVNISNATGSYRVVREIVQFALARNLTELARGLHRGDTAMVLLRDADMHVLTGGLLARRRPPTTEQMTTLVTWFARYFVASKQICAIKSLNPYVTVSVLRFERRQCRSIICAFRRQYSSELKQIQLQPDGYVTVREGFLLPGKLVR